MCFYSLYADQVIMVHFIQSFGCQNNKAHILRDVHLSGDQIPRFPRPRYSSWEGGAGTCLNCIFAYYTKLRKSNGATHEK